MKRFFFSDVVQPPGRAGAPGGPGGTQPGCRGLPSEARQPRLPPAASSASPPGGLRPQCKCCGTNELRPAGPAEFGLLPGRMGRCGGQATLPLQGDQPMRCLVQRAQAAHSPVRQDSPRSLSTHRARQLPTNVHDGSPGSDGHGMSVVRGPRRRPATIRVFALNWPSPTSTAGSTCPSSSSSERRRTITGRVCLLSVPLCAQATICLSRPRPSGPSSLLRLSICFFPTPHRSSPPNPGHTKVAGPAHPVGNFR